MTPRANVFPLALAAVAVIYLIQSLSPLRLDNDSVVYLRIGRALADGVTPPPMGLPKGYPAIVAILDRAHLANSITFVVVNCLFIFLGLASLWHIIGPKHDRARKWVVILATLSYPIIRALEMPLPEPAYFGISLAAVATMCEAHAAHGGRRTRLLLGALALTAISITLRLVGLALMPAFLWTLFSRAGFRHVASRMESAERWLAILCVLVLPVGIAVMLDESFHKYSREGTLLYLGTNGAHHLLTHARAVVGTFGVLVLNLPGGKVHLNRLVFLETGVFALVCILLAVRVRKPLTPVGWYLATFVTMLVLWPYDAVRLWVPIIPLMMAAVSTSTLRFSPSRGSRIIFGAYLAFFCATGIVALTYTTRITFSGQNFAKVYGRAGGMATPDNRGWINQEHNEFARQLMKRYGRPF